jgi:hypothetical protein
MARIIPILEERHKTREVLEDKSSVDYKDDADQPPPHVQTMERRLHLSELQPSRPGHTLRFRAGLMLTHYHSL